MRIEQARRRLSVMPARLPPPPDEIVPRALPVGDEPVPPLPTLSAADRRTAAVLILIFPGPDKEAQLVLIERAAGDHRHAGQISLPGGAVDPTDESIVATALREAAEEVGLDIAQAGVEVVGVLPVVDVRVSGFLVHPVVAFAERAPQLVADGHEVAEVFLAPLSAFLPGAPIETVTSEREGFRLRYGGYRIGRHHVWGATASILGQLGVYLASQSG